jgi:hypothetical protein
MYLSVDIPGETAMRHLAIIKMKCEQCDLRAARTVRGLGPSSSTFKWIAPFALALGNATWRHDGDSRLEPPHRDIVNETLAATTNHIPMAHTREAHMKRTDAKPLEISCRASKAKAVFGAGTFNDWQPAYTTAVRPAGRSRCGCRRDTTNTTSWSTGNDAANRVASAKIRAVPNARRTSSGP